MKNKRSVALAVLIAVLIAGCGWFIHQTRRDLLPVPASFGHIVDDFQKRQFVDRHGTPLTITYQNKWNVHEYLPLHEIPEPLRRIFVLSEDKRFHTHNGVDWTARAHALWQNMRAFRAVRGASTISEQVIRMLHPRPRTVWSRWLEGIEAGQLEKRLSKADILEFYLNQVPYASNRKGVVQAARYYFDRDLDTLSLKEMIALAVLVRAPSRFDLYRAPNRIHSAVARLAGKLARSGVVSKNQLNQIEAEALTLSKPRLTVDAAHFVSAISSKLPESVLRNQRRIRTTLDGHLQQAVQQILDKRLKDLHHRKVGHGAVIVVDHWHNEILAWVVAGWDRGHNSGITIDAAITLRQPGSALKPFLYAEALEKGWTGATAISDQSLIEPVGLGLHTYHNYSRFFYGTVSLRHALGNSLNIPAIRTIRFVGVDRYLALLRELGFKSLTKHPDFYGHGLALGNGEVTLMELVQAYTVLARFGDVLPLTGWLEPDTGRRSHRVFSKQTTSIIANILADASARLLEFGKDSILNFPLQTAVKTGTSSDYRDAWAVGYNYHYTAGIWMGNLDGTPTDGVTGANGPAMALRSVFNELNKHKQTRPLYMSPKLILRRICDPTLVAPGDDHCYERTEWFAAGTAPPKRRLDPALAEEIDFKRPAYGLQLALDPRIPDDQEAFEFYIAGLAEDASVAWVVDDKHVATTRGGKYLWQLKQGRHRVQAAVWRAGALVYKTRKVPFWVK